jgi:signal transduction histidine kinase
MSPARVNRRLPAGARPSPVSSLDRLKVWAIGLPIVLLLLLEAFEYEVLEPRLPAATAHSVAGSLMVLGILAYSAVMWRVFQQAEEHLRVVAAGERRQRQQLEALHEATLDMAADLDLGTVLQRVVESARQIIGARYGALAVLGPGGIIDGFYTAGMDQATRVRLGPPPAGHGLLGLVIERGRALRLDDIRTHPARVGFPDGHPAMTRLLAVPLRWQGDIIGSLYLTDTVDGHPFSPDDEAALERFAAHGATAIANARLYAQVQRLAVVEERERIAMDLHDGVIQSLYGASLTMDSLAARMDDTPEAQELDALVGRLQGVIGDIRHYIFDLRQAHAAGEPLARALRRLLAETGAEHVTKQAAVADDLGAVPERVASHVWHIAHEALANAVRHSGAKRILLGARRVGEDLVIWVEDDGRGFDPDAAPAGHGVDHIRRRLEAVGGHLEVESAPGQGTRLSAVVPLREEAEEEGE